MATLITPGQEKQLRRLLADAMEAGVGAVLEKLSLTQEMAQAFLEQGDVLTATVKTDLLARAKALKATSDHRVDLNADPFVPTGYTVKQHTRGGIFYYDRTRIDLFLTPSQQQGKPHGGVGILEQLEGKNLPNACLLDYFLAHPEIILPHSLNLIFWGTLYQDIRSQTYVRSLRVGGRDGRESHMLSLSGSYLADCPAVIIKPQ